MLVLVSQSGFQLISLQSLGCGKSMEKSTDKATQRVHFILPKISGITKQLKKIINKLLNNIHLVPAQKYTGTFKC